jgi:rSAM/selenodomain-associated transferase 2
MEISFIIPAVNEAGRIGEQVERCLALSPRPEVIVADGGSCDDTASRAGEAGARVVLSPRRGRAFQMNAGAAAASGDVLVFLHADVKLNCVAYGVLRKALADPGLVGGAFRRRFDSPSRLLRAGCRLADLRGRWLRVFLGDQAIFVRRKVFRALGGFREILLFEDLEFSRRLARHGRTVLLEAVVVASGRRFDRDGILARLATNLYLTALYFAGADPDRLARRYYPGHFTFPTGGAAPSSTLTVPPGTADERPMAPPASSSRGGSE